MSRTLDHTEPAGATLSTLAFSIDRHRAVDLVVRRRDVGLARRARPPSATVPVMPSGSKMRVRTNSVHGMPLTAATTSPAAAYITFW